MSKKYGLRSIRLSVLSLSLIPLLVLLLVVAIMWQLQFETQSAAAVAQHSDDVLEQAHRLQNDLGAAEDGVRSYSVTGSARAYAAFTQAATAIPIDAARLQTLVRDNPSQTARERRLSSAAGAETRALTALLSLMRSGDRRAIYSAQIRRTLSNPKTQSVQQGFLNELTQFERAENDLKARRRTATNKLWIESSIVLVVSTLAGIAISLTLNLTFGRRIVTRLQRLADQATVFATKQTVLEPLDGRDEVADLSRTIRDMSDQIKERNAALARYKLLAENVPDSIFFFRRADARILEANQAAVNTYGYTLDELRSMTGYDLRSPGEGWSDEQGLPPEETFGLTLESMHRRKDGSTFPVEITLQSTYIDGEHIMLGVIRDITQRRAADETIRTALNQAMEASRVKSEFVATMSHEIRTPMNGVVGMTELLLETPLSGEQIEYATTARDSAHSLLDVIDNILDFSKIEARKITLEYIEFNLVLQIESIAAMVAAQAQAKFISVMTYVDPAVPARVVGDPVRLRQVLVNLVGNAIKFTAQGGVTVTADLVSSTPERTRIRFAVRDTGIGIEAKAITSLFEAFRQADSSTTRHYGGTGLGLAISKQLVELMGGTIEVESVAGSGSTFSFTLDFRIGTSAQDLPARRGLNEARAIVVDDDVMARDILSRYLSSWGMFVRTAETAEEALRTLKSAQARQEPYDIAVIDLRMPDVDGMSLARLIKGEPAIARTKLVLVTAYSSREQGPAAISAGFSSYLTKPVRQSQLYDSIVEARFGSETVARVQPKPSTVAHSDRILLAEDNAVNRQVATRQLQNLGYLAETVTNGRDAVDRALREEYDLIFMDCQMPIMDGFEATKAIRKHESRTGKHVPIVAMTANALARDRDQCIAAGMDDYLAKPVSLDDLRTVFKKWLLVKRPDG